MNGPRSRVYVWLPLLIAFLGLALVAVVAWQGASFRSGESDRDCRRAVAAREDGRAMWLYLLDTTTPDNPESQARYDAFVKELNDRLPSLRCVNDNPTPIQEEKS